MKQRIMSVMVCAALLSALLAVSPSTNVTARQEPGSLRLGLTVPFDQIDPPLVENSSEALIVEQLFMGLVGLDADGNIVPELAKSWEISEDGRTLTFSLREGVLWINSNRRPVRDVNAEDVRFTFDRARQFGNFDGVIEAVEVVDDYTVILIVQGFFPDLLTVLAVAPAAKIVPVDLVLETGQDVWTLPGTIWSNGPYLLVDRSRTTLVLEANSFWEGERTDAANAVRVEYTPDPQDALRRYVNGEFDLIELEIEFRDALAQDPGFAQRIHFEAGIPLDLFNNTFFTRQTGFGHGYLVKEYLLPVYSPYFGLAGFHLWGFNNQIPEIQISENTRVLNQETLRALTSLDGQGTLIFERETAQLSLIQPGDILVGDSTERVDTDAAPYGFLLKVTKRFLDGGRFVVETDPAFLDQAVVRGSLANDLEIDLNNIFATPPVSSAPQSEGIVPVAYAPPYAGLEFKIDNVLYDADGDETNTTNDQVRALGKVKIEPGAGLHLSLDIANNHLQRLRFTNSLKQSAELRVYSNVNLIEYEKSKVVKRFIFAPQTIFIGWVPVVITPELSVVVGVKGNVSVKISTGLEQSSEITVGAGYDNGAWNPIIEVTDVTVNPLETVLEQGAAARAFAGPELAVTVYGVAGPYGRIQGYLALSADPLAVPRWELNGGVDGEVGVKAQIFSVVDMRYRETFDLYGPVLIAQDGTVVPTAVFVAPTPIPTPAGGGTDRCDSAGWWSPGCWDWRMYLIVAFVGFLVLRGLFGRRKNRD